MSDAPPLPPPKPSSRTTTPQVTPQRPPPPPLSVPSEPFVPPMLANKPLADLQYLLYSPTLLDSLFTATHPTSQTITSGLTTALQSNTQHAQHLSQLETQLISQRQAVQQKLIATRGLEEKWRSTEQEMYRALKGFSSPALYARMKEAVEEAERESEVVEAALVDGVAAGEGGSGVEGWVRGYREGRKVLGLRRERVGRWDEGRVGGWR